MSPTRTPLEPSSTPCAEWRLLSVRPAARPVKRSAWAGPTRLFRPRGVPDSLHIMLLPDQPEPVRSGPVATQGVLSALRHEPFFAALAGLEGHEGSGDWRATVAGLVTLRLVDRRTARIEDRAPGGLDSARPDGLTTDLPPDVIEAARQAVGDVDRQHAVAGPLRELLRSVTAAVADDLPQRVLAYGHALHADSRWSLAADVYRAVLRLAEAPRRTDPSTSVTFVPLAYDRLGHSLRMVGDLDGASAAYAAGRAAARALGDGDADRLIRISEAKILIHLGNLPAAAAALDTVIQDAKAAKSIAPTDLSPAIAEKLSGIDDGDERLDVVALAQHDRAVVASLQHDFNFAAEQYFAAWRAYRDPVRRERVWVDLAGNFAEMGLREVAREALLPLYANAHRRDIRLIAATNLLELAVLDGREDLFETYRRTLHDAADAGTLPSDTAAKFALYEGRGEARFGRPSAAVAAFERALTLAARHRVNEVAIRTDEALAALAALRTGRPVADWFAPLTPTSMSPSVERITRVVRRARRRAEAPRHE